MKHALIGAAIALLLFALLVVFLRYREQAKREERAAERLPQLHSEAYQALDLCESSMESLPSNLAMGTSRFEGYLAMDRARLAPTLTDVVMPLVDSLQLVCGHGQTLLEIYYGDSGDREALFDLVTTKAHLARLERLELEVKQTREAAQRGAGDAELRERFVRLRAR